MNNEFNGMMPQDFVETARRAVAACEGKHISEQAVILAENGFLGICASEDAAGLGLPIAFAVPVVSEAGAGLLKFPLIETMLLATSLSKSAHLDANAIIAGEKIATVAWKGSVSCAVSQSGFKVDGVVASAPLAHDAHVVLVRSEDGRGIIVNTSAHGVSIEPQLHSLDEAYPEFRLRFTDVLVDENAILSAETMQEIDDQALILRAASILGSAQFCLDAAQEHATTRKQFGKPLIAYQAIRHQLARQKLMLESSRVLLGRAVAQGAMLHSVRSAFAVAITGGIAIAEGAIQIHGGMGFTWEVPLHFHLRHIRTLDAQGNASENLDNLTKTYIDALPASGVAA